MHPNQTHITAEDQQLSQEQTSTLFYDDDNNKNDEIFI